MKRWLLVVFVTLGFFRGMSDGWQISYIAGVTDTMKAGDFKCPTGVTNAEMKAHLTYGVPARRVNESVVSLLMEYLLDRGCDVYHSPPLQKG